MKSFRKIGPIYYGELQMGADLNFGLLLKYMLQYVFEYIFKYKQAGVDDAADCRCD